MAASNKKECGGSNRAIHHGSGTGCRHDSGANSDNEPQGRSTQCKRCGDRKIAPYDVVHRFGGEKRFAEVPADKTAKESEILDHDRLIQTETMPHQLQRLLAGLSSGNQACDVTRRRKKHHKDAGGDEPDDQQSPQQTSNKESRHAFEPIVLS